MKTFFTYFALVFCVAAFSQRLQNISASAITGQNQTSSQVLIRFTIAAGIACPGYEILHCTDSINFIQVYNYAGICGNQSTDESFSFTHGSPGLEMVNYYRVSIPGYETSPTQRIYVGNQASNASMFVYPNPAFSESMLRLKFYNYAGTNVDGYVYNQFGVAIKPLSLAIKQDVSEFNISDLDSGLYIVWLTDGNWLFRAKFIVKRA